MAHYAFLDENNVVTEVIAGTDGLDMEAVYGEVRGQVCKKTCADTLGGVYYDAPNQPAVDQAKAFRKNYAGIGFSYDYARDAFIPPKPYPSWLLDEMTCMWHSPVPHPGDGKQYLWDEDTLSWIESVRAT